MQHLNNPLSPPPASGSTENYQEGLSQEIAQSTNGYFSKLPNEIIYQIICNSLFPQGKDFTRFKNRVFSLLSLNKNFNSLVKELMKWESCKRVIKLPLWSPQILISESCQDLYDYHTYDKEVPHKTYQLDSCNREFLMKMQSWKRLCAIKKLDIKVSSLEELEVLIRYTDLISLKIQDLSNVFSYKQNIEMLKSFNCLEKLCLDLNGYFDDSHLETLLECCPHLTHLEIHNSACSIKAFKIVSQLPLRHFGFINPLFLAIEDWNGLGQDQLLFRDLETLDLTGCLEINPSVMNNLTWCPSLKRLIINNDYQGVYDGLWPSNPFSDEEREIVNFAKLEHLKELDVVKNYFLSLPVIASQYRSLPNLEVLDAFLESENIFDTDTEENEFFEALENLQKLHTLSLYFWHSESGACINHIFNLNSLTIHNRSQIDDQKLLIEGFNSRDLEIFLGHSNIRRLTLPTCWKQLSTDEVATINSKLTISHLEIEEPIYTPELLELRDRSLCKLFFEKLVNKLANTISATSACSNANNFSSFLRQIRSWKPLLDSSNLLTEDPLEDEIRIAFQGLEQIMNQNFSIIHPNSLDLWKKFSNQYTNTNTIFEVPVFEEFLREEGFDSLEEESDTLSCLSLLCPNLESLILGFGVEILTENDQEELKKLTHLKEIIFNAHSEDEVIYTKDQIVASFPNRKRKEISDMASPAPKKRKIS